MSVMVFSVGLVEDKDQPNEREKPEFEADYRENGGIMMRNTKPLFGTGKAVVTDNGFCVLEGVVGMLAHGVYRTTVLKKKDIVPSTARKMPLRHASDTKRLGMCMLFVVICIDTSTRYSV